MARFRTPTVVSLSALALLVASGILYAGPLTPPAGPVTSTTKTLGEVEPRTAVNAINTPGDANSLFRITQPGSYYLTGNITGIAGKHGVVITTSGVTLDLNGFDLAGTPGMGGFDGIVCVNNNQRDISVLKGSVRNWGRHGINLGEFVVTGGRIENVNASGNANVGCYAGGSTTVSSCTANGGNYGILARAGSTISDCSATNANIAGIYADSSSLFNCSAFGNESDGIQAVDSCIVTNCSSRSNTRHGILLTNGSTVSDCTTRENGGSGIQCRHSNVLRKNNSFNDGYLDFTAAGIHVLEGDNRIEGNNCTYSSQGFRIDGASNFIVQNSCRNNGLNWNVAEGNVIWVVQGFAASGFSGNSGGSPLGSIDGHANFTY